MRQGYVLKKGKKFVNLNTGDYTKSIDRATVYVTKSEAHRDIVVDGETPVQVTITVEEKS